MLFNWPRKKTLLLNITQDWTSGALGDPASYIFFSDASLRLMSVNGETIFFNRYLEVLTDELFTAVVVYYTNG